MKARNILTAITFVAICGLASSSRATLVVNDTWQDGTRTDPAPPTYSEYGVDSEPDGDIESAWFVGASGGLSAVPGTMTMSNDITHVGGSSIYTTYFTPESTPVTLVGAGDTMKVTWVFTPRNVNSSNTSQGLNFAVVNSPGAARLTVDGSPGSAIYAGYSMAMNMGNTLKNANPFLLREWKTPGATSALLSSSGAWANLTGGGIATGDPLNGYFNDTSYTFMMQFTVLTGGNLEIAASMAGDSIGGTGLISLVYTDTSPNSLTFDTASIRPSTTASTADAFDTTLFKVETNTVIPEPSTLALVAAGLSMMFAMIRRRRS